MLCGYSHDAMGGKILTGGNCSLSRNDVEYNNRTVQGERNLKNGKAD
jgi:hypothetical protein